MATVMTLVKNMQTLGYFFEPLYAQEVALLEPGTVLPSLSTISRDVNQIYVTSSNYVKDYFSVCPIFDNTYLLN